MYSWTRSRFAPPQAAPANLPVSVGLLLPVQEFTFSGVLHIINRGHHAYNWEEFDTRISNQVFFHRLYHSMIFPHVAHIYHCESANPAYNLASFLALCLKTISTKNFQNSQLTVIIMDEKGVEPLTSRKQRPLNVRSERSTTELYTHYEFRIPRGMWSGNNQLCEINYVYKGKTFETK